MTGREPIFAALGDELVRHRDEDGRVLYDLDGLTLADADEPAPVRLLGRYDNLWLSHAARDRVTPDPARGALDGLQRRRRPHGVRRRRAGRAVAADGDGRVEVELFGRLARAERADLDDEVGRVESLLALP